MALSVSISDRQQQEDEILVLSNIYRDNEFSFTNGDTIECYYNFCVNMKHASITLENAYTCDSIETNASPLYCVKYLPPIRMYLQLPEDYPTKSSPKFYIIASWLSPWQISLVCQKLDDIWLNNNGQVLFLWFEWFRNDLLNFLCIENALDITFMYMVYYNLNEYFQLNLMFQNDTRAIYNILFCDPISFLHHYDKNQQKVEFDNGYYLCNVCIQEYSGKNCIQLESCKHVYCQNCMKEYICTKINEHTGVDITCPTFDCSSTVLTYEIKDLISPELFSKYEKLLLDVALSTMKNVIFCPRISCQYPMINETSDTTVICRMCSYAFCSYCKKAYHGVSSCLSLCDMEHLIVAYKTDNNHQVRQLEKKYGRRQAQLVEMQLTRQYLQKNAKSCPNCRTMISKIDGCNKVTCTYCRASFCWICEEHILTKNVYDHFLTGSSNCYKRLYD